MELRDALRGTGAVRTFTDEAVDEALVRDILDDARFAPNGGNRQSWRVALVDDPGQRRRLADVMRPVVAAYAAEGASGATPFTVAPRDGWVRPEPPYPEVANPLVEDIETVPVVLVVAADLGRISMMDKDLGRPTIVGGASVYPFCWSILLAARARGLGAVLTTFLARAEHEIASDLALPEHWAIAATIYLGHPVHQPTRLTREPVESFLFRNRFDVPA